MKSMDSKAMAIVPTSVLIFAGLESFINITSFFRDFESNPGWVTIKEWFRDCSFLLLMLG